MPTMLDIYIQQTMKYDLTLWGNKYYCLVIPISYPYLYPIFCVQYARMRDVKKANEMFRRCYEPNLRAPFGVIAETATSNNPYFATGAGGLLQAVINGFCGLQITDEGIVQVPSILPKHWKKVTMTGVGPEKKTFERSQR